MTGAGVSIVGLAVGGTGVGGSVGSRDKRCILL